MGRLEREMDCGCNNRRKGSAAYVKVKGWIVYTIYHQSIGCAIIHYDKLRSLGIDCEYCEI